MGTSGIRGMVHWSSHTLLYMIKGLDQCDKDRRIAGIIAWFLSSLIMPIPSSVDHVIAVVQDIFFIEHKLTASQKKAKERLYPIWWRPYQTNGQYHFSKIPPQLRHLNSWGTICNNRHQRFLPMNTYVSLRIHTSYVKCHPTNNHRAIQIDWSRKRRVCDTRDPTRNV